MIIFSSLKGPLVFCSFGFFSILKLLYYISDSFFLIGDAFLKSFLLSLKRAQKLPGHNDRKTSLPKSMMGMYELLCICTLNCQK